MHIPVLLNEVLNYLNLASGKKIIDATLNGGGHTAGILEKHPDIKILGLEWDPDIVENLKTKIQNEKLFGNLKIINDSYVNLGEIAKQCDFEPDGILFDLGLSSWHYEQSGRGFSFKKNEVLDMRFNPRMQEQTAADILNTVSQKELEVMTSRYGEEKFASQISKAIIQARKDRPVMKTGELVRIIEEAVPTWYRKRKIHPATKTFQALRIEVNQELDNVERGVLKAIEVLKNGGRLIVISFHGLEDKIVREIFKEKVKEGIIRWVTRGTIRPRWEEIQNNPRARSAKMKVVEKI